MCELKFLNACKSRYPRNPRRRDGARAVERRAEGLTEEYCKSAREVDWKYCGVPRPPPPQPGVQRPPRQIGPVESRLNNYGRVRGWVFGAFGECSNEVHLMVQRLAEAKVQRAGTQPGRSRLLFKSREAQLAEEVAFIRRRLSFTAVQQQARLILDRLQLLGEGASEAARRRDWAEQANRADARERRAQLVCLQQGQNIRRSGFAYLD